MDEPKQPFILYQHKMFEFDKIYRHSDELIPNFILSLQSFRKVKHHYYQTLFRQLFVQRNVSKVLSLLLILNVKEEVTYVVSFPNLKI